MAADPAVGRADAEPQRRASPEAQAAQLMFERHGARVLAYCRRRLASPEEAEDALQTTFLYACRGLRRGVVPVTEIAWLLKIAHNVCLSNWDSARRRRGLELVRDPERLDASTPAAAVARDELHALEAALAELTDLQRRAIVLREWRGLSYDEIAVELGLSGAAVETLIFRARRALAGGLEQQDVCPGRTRLVRGLDVGGLLAGLKSALGGGVAAKVTAAGLAVGAAMLAGSVPQEASGPPAPTRAPVSSPPAAPVVADPATAPAARAVATAASRETVAKAPRAEKPRAARRTKKRDTPAQRPAPGPSPTQPPTLGETVGQVNAEVGATVDHTLTASAGNASQAVATVTETAESTVGAVPEVLGPTVDLVDGVLGSDGLLP